MNTLSASYNRSPNFGMAFMKPNKQVMSYMRDAVSELTPECRGKFVDRMAHIVKNSEKNTVPIEQSLGGSYSPVYVAKVGNKYFTPSQNTRATKAEQILDVMDRASKEAENIDDINNNMTKIGKLFNIEG